LESFFFFLMMANMTRVSENFSVVFIFISFMGRMLSIASCTY
jgi:hypothetical protein